MHIKANYHTHSTFCDGVNTPRENVEEALKLGMTHLGFSGHMDPDVHMDFDLYLQEIRKLQIEYKDKIEILCGVELDALYDSKYADDVEYVIGSTHFLDVAYERPLSIDDTPEDVVILCNEFFGGNYYSLCKAYYELEATVIDRFPVTFIGHFDLITKFNHVLNFVNEEDVTYLKPAFEAIEYIAERRIPFEVNTRQAFRGKLFPAKNLLKFIHERGGEIILSSDAHKSGELLNGFSQACEAIKACGFHHINILERSREQTAVFKQIAI